MPRTLKRRSNAISRDNNDDDNDEDQIQAPPSRRQRTPQPQLSSPSPPASPASSAASSSSPDNDDDAASPTTQTQSQHSVLIKKLIRLALATEYSRTPLRRNDITTKIFKDSSISGRQFKSIFTSAQTVLEKTFGVKLVELPGREKTSLKDRRTQATQTQSKASAGSTSKSWVLVSVLPEKYKTNPKIVQPAKAASVEAESGYTALYTFILALVYLNSGSLPEQKLERYLGRVNADTYTDLGSLEKLLQRMAREGYIEKRREDVAGEDSVSWVVGPRGKVEVGVKGVVGLVKAVYGFGAGNVLNAGPGRNGAGDRGGEAENDGEDDAEEGEGNENGNEVVEAARKKEETELNARISRSLGIAVGERRARENRNAEEDEEREED